ncbi:MAG TPA: glycosyl transferase [Porticoccaceae bacterium]|nr:glycosyl transferase [Porticoccaceae bacterium]
MTPSLSIVIPTLNEAATIKDCLQALSSVRDLGAQIIVADGGSYDETVTRARAGADKVVVSKPGRAGQMNAGAREATGQWLLFLHADTRLPENMADVITAWEFSHSAWGFFFVRLDSPRMVFRIIERLMNWRSYYSRIATGDQSLFVKRELFERLGGYADIPLMEDIELSKRLRRTGRPLVALARATTSARKWEREGVVSTVLLMWRLRLAYFFGADPAELVRKYYRANPVDNEDREHRE